MNTFKEYWKVQQGHEIFEKKASLSQAEILEIQKKIAEMQKKGFNSDRIISALQRFNGKLSERYKAERAYWTEVKSKDTELIGEAGEELDISKYKVILSPNACPICREKTQQGSKVFKGADLEKAGYGHVPPFHPNCYCIMYPVE